MSEQKFNWLKKAAKSITALVASTLILEASAISRLSRACAQNEAADVVPGVLHEPTYTSWALETFTTDFASSLGDFPFLSCPSEEFCYSIFPPRFYLLAHAAIYQRYRPSSFANPEYRLLRTHQGEWSTSVIADQFVGIYRARAGKPINYGLTLFQNELVAGLNYDNYLGTFLVKGEHYFYDPLGRTHYYAGASEATTCNLAQFGFNPLSYTSFF